MTARQRRLNRQRRMQLWRKQRRELYRQVEQHGVGRLITYALDGLDGTSGVAVSAWRWAVDGSKQVEP